MATTKLGFVVQRPPYKSENPKLAITHAISSQSVEIYLEDGDLVECELAFVGDGVLNCLTNQKAADHYDITSTEQQIKMALLLDIPIYICKEDLEKFGYTEDDVVTDAEEFGAEIEAKVVPFAEITKMMENSNHLLFF